MPNIQKARRINGLMKGVSLVERLELIKETSVRPVFQTTFKREDQFLLWAIHSAGQPFEIASPRFQDLTIEQKTLLKVTQERYGEDVVKLSGPADISLPPALDHIADGLVTSRLSEFSHDSTPLPFVVWNPTRATFVFNPLADLTRADVEAEIFAHEIPVNLETQDESRQQETGVPAFKGVAARSNSLILDTFLT